MTHTNINTIFTYDKIKDKYNLIRGILMITITPEELSQRDNYKLLIGSIVPRPIALITSQSDQGIINGAPFSFFNVVSSKPPMIFISVGRKNGVMKDTSHNIKQNKEFVVHIVDQDNVKKVNETAASLPANESEIELAHLNLIDSELVSVPGIKESKIRFECKLHQIVELGNDSTTNTDLIIGEIVRYHFSETVYEDGKINIEQLNPMSRLAGADYATIGNIQTLKRPK